MHRSGQPNLTGRSTMRAAGARASAAQGSTKAATHTAHEILAYTAGKMRKFRIRTGVGDRVVVEMSPYDLQRGRISFRHKSAAPPMIGSGQRRPQYRR